MEAEGHPGREVDAGDGVPAGAGRRAPPARCGRWPGRGRGSGTSRRPRPASAERGTNTTSPAVRPGAERRSRRRHRSRVVADQRVRRRSPRRRRRAPTAAGPAEAVRGDRPAARRPGGTHGRGRRAAPRGPCRRSRSMVQRQSVGGPSFGPEPVGVEHPRVADDVEHHGVAVVVGVQRVEDVAGLDVEPLDLVGLAALAAAGRPGRRRPSFQRVREAGCRPWPRRGRR